MAYVFLVHIYVELTCQTFVKGACHHRRLLTHTALRGLRLHGASQRAFGFVLLFRGDYLPLSVSLLVVSKHV